MLSIRVSRQVVVKFLCITLSCVVTPLFAPGLLSAQGPRQSRFVDIASINQPANVAVIGEVSQPGIVRLAQGPILVKDVIEKSGGLNNQSSGHATLVRQGRSVSLILNASHSQQQLIPQDILVLTSQSAFLDMKQSSAPQPDIQQLHIALVGVMNEPLVIPVETFHSQLKDVWCDLLNQKIANLPQLQLVDASQSRPMAKGTTLSLETHLDNGQILVCPPGSFQMNLVQPDVQKWLNDPKLPLRHTAQNEPAQIDVNAVSHKPIEQTPAADVQERFHSPKILPRKELVQPEAQPTYPMEIPLETTLETPANDGFTLPLIPNSTTKDTGKETGEKELPLLPLDGNSPVTQFQHDQATETAQMLIPGSLHSGFNVQPTSLSKHVQPIQEQSEQNISAPWHQNASARVTMKNDLNETRPELITEIPVMNPQMQDSLVVAALNAPPNDAEPMLAPWEIDAQGPPVPTQTRSGLAESFSPRRLTQTRPVDSEPVVDGLVPMPRELDQQSSSTASLKVTTLVSYLSGLAAVMAVICVMMSAYLNMKATAAEAQKVLASVNTQQATTQKAEASPLRRQLQDLIENNVVLIEEKVVYPNEVPLFDMTPVETQMRRDERHLESNVIVPVAGETITTPVQYKMVAPKTVAAPRVTTPLAAQETETVLDNQPAAGSTFYRTDSTEPSIAPAPHAGVTRVERALHKTQREETRS
jgi:hypothetical protein